MKFIHLFLFLFAGLILFSCRNSPKVIEVTQDQSSQTGSGNTGIFSSGQEGAGSANVPPVNAEVHTAKALEVLPTERYVYVRVEENGEQYWIATTRQEVEVGKTYFFKDGLLKLNFESKEYNRVFDRIYLVSSIVSADHAHESGTRSTQVPSEIKPSGNIEKPIRVEGSLAIADLVANPEKYAGKEIQLSGVCTKINPNIMGRNWIHLQDGTKDDYDLVLTSSMIIPEGAVITMKGKVALGMDFGAGYKYDILVEDAVMVK
jgi:hypothetical protein